MSFLYAIAVISLSVMLPVLLSLRKTDVPGITSFCIGCLLSVVSCGVELAVSVAPLWLTAVIGSTAMIAASLMMMKGFQQFLGRPALSVGVIVVVFATAAGWLTFFSYGIDSLAARICITAGLSALIQGMTGATILRHCAARRTIALYMLICAVSAFVAATVYSLLVVAITAGVDAPDNIGSPYLWITALEGAQAMLMPLLFLCIILMLQGWIIVYLRHTIAHDDLTGALSRRAFMAEYRRMSLASATSGVPTTFMLLDLDRFKQINDRYGHAGGDTALCHFTEVVRATLAARGILGRLGGEEFGIVIVDSDLNETEDIAEEICQAVRTTPAENIGGNNIFLTVSIGIAVGEPGDAVADVMARADKALYEAKALGRDRVCIAGSSREKSTVDSSARVLAGAAAQMRAQAADMIQSARSAG